MPPAQRQNQLKGRTSKQSTLSFGWKLSTASASTHRSPLPDVLPSAPTPTPKRLKPSPPPPEVDSWDAVLQVRTTVNSLVDRIVEFHERDANAIALECHNMLSAAIDFVILNSNLQQPTISTTPDVKSKRMQYKTGEKVKAVQLVTETSRSKGLRWDTKRLNKVPGYEKVTATMVSRWSTAGPSKKSGRKVNSAFEMQVINQFIYTEFENVNGVEVAVIKANVAHSYGVLMAAARSVQVMPQFADDTKVAKLQFSRKWVVGFLRRATLRRRRVTAVDKALPPVDQVRSRMAGIQKPERSHHRCIPTG